MINDWTRRHSCTNQSPYRIRSIFLDVVTKHWEDAKTQARGGSRHIAGNRHRTIPPPFSNRYFAEKPRWRKQTNKQTSKLTRESQFAIWCFVFFIHGVATAGASVAGKGVVAVVVVKADLTATHFSFLFSSATAGESEDFSDSSSEVTLSSVSASTPVLVSDSELEDEDEPLSVVTATAGVDSVDEVEVATEESLFAPVSERSFLALARSSLLSSFFSSFYTPSSFSKPNNIRESGQTSFASFSSFWLDLEHKKSARIVLNKLRRKEWSHLFGNLLLFLREENQLTRMKMEEDYTHTALAAAFANSSFSLSSRYKQKLALTWEFITKKLD